MSNFDGCVVPESEIDRVVNGFMTDTRLALHKMINQIRAGVRFFVVPLHDGVFLHWHLLIFDMLERKMYTRNSLWGYRSKPIVWRMVSALYYQLFSHL